MPVKSRHSFVHDIKIASPCSANWDDMTGDEQQRACHSCRKNVYNLAAMTLAEAEELIISKEGNLCVRLFRRHDGTVLTKDCPVGLAAVRARFCKTAAAIVVVFASWMLTWRNGQTDAPLWQKLSAAFMPHSLAPGPLAPSSGGVSPVSYSGSAAGNPITGSMSAPEVKGRMLMGDVAVQRAPGLKANR